jgi:hypothetical protein
LSEKLFALFTSWRYGLSDPLCGLKAYNLKLLSDGGIVKSYDSVGTETLLRGLRRSLPFQQVPIEVAKRIDESRMGSSLSGNMKIFKSLVKWLFIEITDKGLTKTSAKA